MIFESNSLEKNFNEIKSDLDKLQDIITNKIKKFEDSTNLKKKREFIKLNLESTYVRSYEPSSIWESGLTLQLNIDNKLLEKIKETNPELFNGVNHKKSYDYIQLKVSEDNKKYIENLNKIIDMIYDIDKELHEQNIEIKKDNQELLNTLFKILSDVGISETYFDYKTRRSSKKSKLYYQFPSEFRKQVTTYYDESKLDNKRKELKDQIKKVFDDYVKKEMEEKKKEEEKLKEQKELKKKVLYLAKYDLDIEGDWRDVLDAILDKNKYLRLAYYLERNRNDWTEGHSYAESGLYGFNVETELDNKIYDNIHGLMYENWDMDGRVFRDCEYNYDVLYGIASEIDPKLIDDYREVVEHIDFY